MRNFQLEAVVHYGFVASHHKYMQHLTQRHFSAFELNLSEQTHGWRLWEQLYKYPKRGIGIYYSTLGNTEVLGHAIAVYPYLNFCLTKGNKVNLYFKTAIGLGYLTKKFNADNNYKNIAISTHLNAFIQLKLTLNWNITDRLVINGGFDISHFSNGAFKIPNLGLNILSLNMGLSYKLSRITPNIIKREVPAYNKKWQYHVFGRFGVNELYPPGGKKYPVYCMTAYFLKPLGIKRLLGVGLDIFYSESVVDYLRRSGTGIKNKVEAVKPGVSAVYEMNFSHLSFVVQFGAYLYAKDKSDGYIYDRVALQYTFKNHYMVQLGMKTHWLKAEVVELSVGYKF
ncbi:MAG: acyloxyacyl hydrolase [Bacteroidales bacterium]|nr:acyloxyacyl hydrolase [Bacteroidales bacterium]